MDETKLNKWNIVTQAVVDRSPHSILIGPKTGSFTYEGEEVDIVVSGSIMRLHFPNRIHVNIDIVPLIEGAIKLVEATN